ncbi:unnamed protein product [Cladocopium goreaui]|uniref:Uncharacterized protein n=1 Tax=Cladocopium goreaui TaxID=2562237 RepID=A0A9P1BRB5_9DINO|nr:unnamed protein product [Cladocopium goreaui]
MPLSERIGAEGLIGLDALAQMRCRRRVMMAFSIPTTMRRFQQSVSTELWPFQKLPVTSRGKDFAILERMRSDQLRLPSWTRFSRPIRIAVPAHLWRWLSPDSVDHQEAHEGLLVAVDRWHLCGQPSLKQ